MNSEQLADLEGRLFVTETLLVRLLATEIRQAGQIPPESSTTAVASRWAEDLAQNPSLPAASRVAAVQYAQRVFVAAVQNARHS